MPGISAGGPQTDVLVNTEAVTLVRNATSATQCVEVHLMDGRLLIVEGILDDFLPADARQLRSVADILALRDSEDAQPLTAGEFRKAVESGLGCRAHKFYE